MAETKKYVRIKKASVDGVWYADKIGQIFEVVRENSVAILTKCGGHHSVLREDAELIVTEKRPAKVGERVLITVAAPIGEQSYETGDVFVAESLYDPFTKDIQVLGMPDFIDYNEYEVIVNSEVKNEEADEMKIDLNAMGYDELIAHGEDVMRAIRMRAYGEGYRQGKFDAEMDSTHGQAPIVSAQARRDEIVEQAKADVEKLIEDAGSICPVYYGNYTMRECTNRVEFVVNREKRTVVALVFGKSQRVRSELREKGIAKAAPNDCFNAHIGKAIALRRALGLAVPDEYLNAPQPTEVRVGDVIEVTLDSGEIEKKPVISLKAGSLNAHLPGRIIQYPSHYVKIINDSREEVGGE
ncbi:hypothetical protein [Bacillus velezensis]|uniref:hypothetical protein n=1 Tax=Bacillus velezensis TaxID=492670 RepID=UPI002DBD2293|nr:hypothetical protein [Bacillus velezensis]MEC3770788.1 hypothetical protein [Bacillus velezensis]